MRRKKRTKATKAKKKSAEGKGPARIIIEKFPDRIVGAIHCPGLTYYPAEWESHLEMKLIMMLLMCHDVSSIKSQHEKFAYQLNDKTHCCFPDATITVSGEDILVEVKKLIYLLKAKELEKILAIATALREQRRTYALITDDQLHPVWTDNAFFLMRCIRWPLKPEVSQHLRAVLADGPRMIGELLAGPQAIACLGDVHAHIAQRQLCIDWDQPLTRQSMVSLPDQPYRGMTYAALRDSGRFAHLLAEVALGRRPSDQRLVEVASALQRPKKGPSPLGFVGGFSPAELGHLGRAVSKAASRDADHRAANTDEST
jgi:hypothetical protein